jgi:rhodanese-related sulfurtransferase
MVKKRGSLPGVMAAALLAVLFWTPAFAGSVATMDKETLKTMMDDADVVILDVRAGRDWKSSEFKIKGAVRANPGEFSAWGTQYAKDKKFILYCA